MAPTDQNTDLIDAFDAMYREYYRDEIAELAQGYPTEKKSLHIAWQDLYRFDPDLADDVRTLPEQLIEYAEEALRLYDLPIDVSLGQAHVRIHNLPESTAIRDLRHEHHGRLLEIEGVVREASAVDPKVTNAAFECQRCGTLTRIPQGSGDLQKPHECMGCERQGSFRFNMDQSEFIEAQDGTLSGSGAAEISVIIEDDIAGSLQPSKPVRITGVLKLEQKEGDDGRFDICLNGIHVEGVDWGEFAEKHGLEFGPNFSGETSPDRLEQFSKQAAYVVSSFEGIQTREEETKAKLVTPFIEALGWTVHDNDEVRLEWEDDLRNRPDYALFGPGDETPSIVVEAKQLKGPVQREARNQVRQYMRICDAEWGVATDGNTYIVYAALDGESDEKRVIETTVRNLHRKPVLAHLTRSAYYNEEFDEEEWEDDIEVSRNEANIDSAISDEDLFSLICTVIEGVSRRREDGAPVEAVRNLVTKAGVSKTRFDDALDELRQQGEVYEPADDRLRYTL